MQDAIALLIVAIAAGYLGRVAWLSFVTKRRGTCGSCGSCATNQKPLVQLVIPREAHRPRDLAENLHTHGNTSSG